MKPKPFALQRLLDIRRARQRQRQLALGEAARKVRRQEEEVQAAISRQVAARDDIRALLAPGPGQARSLPLREIRQYRMYLAALGRLAAQAAAPLAALRQSEAAQRAELVEARRATRVLENLRQRRAEAGRRWARRREQKTADDVVAAYAQRGRRSS